MKDIRQEVKDHIEAYLVGVDDAVKAFETLSITLRDCHFDNDKWNNVQLKDNKPYYRMNEKY